jgi:DNA-binding transcriptional LysR family regulator
MDLVGMEVFARVVEANSFSGAARRLKLSKSLVSKHVTQLEKGLGVRLLNRTTRAVSLTEIGREFYERCVAIVAAAEQAERIAIERQSRPHGMIRVAAPVAFGTTQLAPMLPPLLRACPGLCIDFTLTNRTVNLIEEGFDAAIVVADRLPPGLVARRIARFARHLCASAAYIATHGAPACVEELREHACLVYTGDGHPRKWMLRDEAGTVAVTPRGVFLANNFSVLHQAALLGTGIAVLPAFLADADLREGRLVQVLPHVTLDDVIVSVVYPPTRHPTPKMRAFIDFVVERFRRMAADVPPSRDAMARAGSLSDDGEPRLSA